ncbi:IclR family transcriptional regulator [Streptomyces sp. NPDC002913]
MKNSANGSPAPGSLESVDNALSLLLALRQEGRLRLSDAADSLGVARSTAHRLLTTLRNRGFAVQGEDKAYRPGPALYRLGMSQRTDYELIETARPYMLRLNEELGETVHLVVRSGTRARFLHSVEGVHALRVSTRAGASLPAHLASGGKVLLAGLSTQELADVYPSGPPEGYADLAALHRFLAGVRRAGYAVNREDTERGITAIGAAVHEPGGRAVAALTVSAPTLRLPRSQVEPAVDVLTAVTWSMTEAL